VNYTGALTRHVSLILNHVIPDLIPDT